MKKSIICIVFATVLLSTSLVSCSYDKETFIEDSGMVYASPNMQEYIYKILDLMIHDESKPEYLDFRQNNYRIVKESIMPVYRLDIFEYPETGHYEIKLRDDVRHVAKVVNEDNEFVENIDFLMLYDDPPFGDPDNPSHESLSYADHAENIKKLLNYDDIVPVSDVKVVSVGGTGECFLIDNSETRVWILMSDYNEPEGSVRYRACSDEDVLAIALYQVVHGYWEEEKATAAEERWEKDNSEDLFSRVDSVFSPSSWESYPVDNIIDIYDYFGLEYEVTEQFRVYDERRIYGWIIVAFACLVVAGAVAAEIVIFRKKKKAREAACTSAPKEE